MLSVEAITESLSVCSKALYPISLTYHVPLFTDEFVKIMKDVVEFMYAGFNLSNLELAFCY